MNSRIYLTREEQVYLMQILEINSPEEALNKFIDILIEEKVDPTKTSVYLKKIMTRKPNV